jgi:hypothetical protein
VTRRAVTRRAVTTARRRGLNLSRLVVAALLLVNAVMGDGLRVARSVYA